MASVIENHARLCTAQFVDPPHIQYADTVCRYGLCFCGLCSPAGTTGQPAFFSGRGAVCGYYRINRIRHLGKDPYLDKFFTRLAPAGDSVLTLNSKHLPENYLYSYMHYRSDPVGPPLESPCRTAEKYAVGRTGCPHPIPTSGTIHSAPDRKSPISIAS